MYEVIIFKWAKIDSLNPAIIYAAILKRPETSDVFEMFGIPTWVYHCSLV